MSEEKRKRPKSRSRRNSDEVRQQILAAARELFNRKGYAKVTTREIAERAAVVEPMVFRHFGSKAGLLEHVVGEPLALFVEGFLRAYEGPDLPSLPIRARVYVQSVFELVRANRSLLAVLLSSEYTVTENAPRLSQILDGLFPKLQNIVQERRRGLGVVTSDIDDAAFLRVRMTFGLIASMVLFDQWLFAPNHPRPSDEDIIRNLVDYILTGYRA